MPTYEYACTSCGRHFDVVQKFSDAPLETCEVCGGKLKRVFHPVGVVLKGSGFYSTDNRGGKSLSPGSKEGATESAPKTDKPKKEKDKKPAKKETGSAAS